MGRSGMEKNDHVGESIGRQPDLMLERKEMRVSSAGQLDETGFKRGERRAFFFEGTKEPVIRTVSCLWRKQQKIQTEEGQSAEIS